ncbi:MAG: DUF499 domain-containing protein [Candidatus Methylomirabilota bacterium]|jgi:hypothetical protein
MSKAAVIQPWKKVCFLRKEIRERVLKLEDFAVDLFLIVHRSGDDGGPFYCDPDQFFATTYATENLRKYCAGILARLAGRHDGVSIVNIAQTFGGGKTHALATMYYLCSLGPKLPKQHPAVAEILAASKMSDPPPARIAAVSFDKVDWKAGGLVKSPSGEARHFRMPWNLIAWQLLGEKGVDILKRDEDEPDYYEPPAQSLWMELLAEVEKEGAGALILLDEFLMWAHAAASPDPDSARQDKGPVWYDRLKNFFQTLSQAVAVSKKSSLVVSLLATDPAKRDEVGTEILARCNAGLNRQADVQTPVDRGDFAELLRRRMFDKFPKGAAECDKHVTAFWHRMQAVEPARAKIPDSKKEMMDAYPFHPDLVNRLFGKWADLRQFQRTRGILQTFSMALREAEGWDESPLVSTQVFLARPDASDDISPALAKLANDAMNSVEETSKPNWPGNLRTEMPRALIAQKNTTLAGREIEAACSAGFIFSQPVGEQAELGELRWLIGVTCDIPAMLNTGLLEWSKTSWYLAECESTDPASGLPRYWRMGPKPNLNQVHDSYKRNALKNARGKFDSLVKECRPLRDGCMEENVFPHLLPSAPEKVKDDTTFRLVVLGAEYAGTPGSAPKANALEFLRTHASPSDQRQNQNVLLVVIPSAAGLLQAEQAVASWMAWGDIKKSESFKDLTPEQQETVRRRERESQKDALTSVKDAFELVIYVDTAGNAQQKKFTMGSEALFPTLMREKDLRIYREKINAETLLPGGPFSKWPPSDPSIKVKDLYGAFGRYPDMPKLVNRQVVINTIEDAVRRGLVALRYMPPGGGEEWFWHCPIEGVVDWADYSEVWLPAKATVNKVHPAAVVPAALVGLYSSDDGPVKLSAVCAWFDGAHAFDEVVQPGYPAEKRPIPKADYKLVHHAVAQAVARGDLWLVFGNDSVLGEKPSDLQLDPDANLLRPPARLRAVDLLPGALAGAWTGTPQKTTVGKLYAELKALRGRPWPTRQFIDVLNEAVNQGILVRVTSGPEFTSVNADVDRALGLSAPGSGSPPPPKPTGVHETTEVAMDLAQLQDFVDESAPALTKLLAGAAPEFAVKIKLKGKAPTDLAKANEVLKKVNPDWQF